MLELVSSLSRKKGKRLLQVFDRIRPQLRISKACKLQNPLRNQKAGIIFPSRSLLEKVV